MNLPNFLWEVSDENLENFQNLVNQGEEIPSQFIPNIIDDINEVKNLLESYNKAVYFRSGKILTFSWPEISGQSINKIFLTKILEKCSLGQEVTSKEDFLLVKTLVELKARLSENLKNFRSLR